MRLFNQEPINYIYNYASSEEEKDLCFLEMRAFFGADSESFLVESSKKKDPSRSPFVRGRLDVFIEGKDIEDILDQIKGMSILDSTYKVVYVKSTKLAMSIDPVLDYEERMAIERKIGLHIQGKVDMRDPEILLGILYVNGRWVFGVYHENSGEWLSHRDKPHNYSTALDTRTARALVNIAVPDLLPHLKVIDPCCGIGTVLIEALSMGIDIVGSDNNPLVMKGIRENILYFGLQGEVYLRDIRDVTGNYDVVIIDLPYNLCSVISPEEQLEMLQSARRFTQKLVLVSVESLDSIIKEAGFAIVDRCELRKQAFIRRIIVCE